MSRRSSAASSTAWARLDPSAVTIPRPAGLIGVLSAMLGIFLVVSPARAADPSFIAGYAGAVLDQYGANGSTVAVEGSTVTISARGLSVPDKESLSRTLLRVEGVSVVRFPPDPRSYPLNDYGRDRWPKTEARAGAGAASAVVPRSGRTAFPRRTLFEPLLADPREARFSVSSLRYRSGADLKRVAAGNFGGTLPMAGGDLDGGGQWQVAVQGAVFTLWDLETFSNDQISDDFLVGLLFAWRWERLSVMARLYHISTHLGDEFLLTHPGLSRVNLAYEAVDLKISYAVGDALRLYGGAGRMIRRDPGDTPPRFPSSRHRVYPPEVLCQRPSAPRGRPRPAEASEKRLVGDGRLAARRSADREPNPCDPPRPLVLGIFQGKGPERPVLQALHRVRRIGPACLLLGA